MREGWKCPVCHRGVSPDERACDHGNGFAVLPVLPTPNPIPFPWIPPYQPFPLTTWGGCDACRRSGVCNCYRPEHGPMFTTSTAFVN
jgi:hypothetical protein